MKNKNIVTTLFILSFLVISVRLFAQGNIIIVNSSDEYTLNLGVFLPSAKFVEQKYSDNNIYSDIIIPGASQLQPGAPNLPVFANWVLIPNGTTPSISVLKGQPVIYENISIPPVQEPEPDIIIDNSSKFIKNSDVYSANANYPGVFAKIEPMNNIRGQNATILWIYPYQYNPVTKTLYVYINLQVILNFNGNIEPIPINLQDQEHERFLRSIAINGNEVLDAENSLQAHGNSSETGYKYLIITHDDFTTAANTLAAWKNSLGISTIVKTTSEIGSTCEQIEAYINTAYQNWNPAPSYLLLIGDREFIPTWYENIHPYHGTETATDIYYADIQHNTNDPIEDISYGRLSVDNSNEANNLVDRIIAYESRPINDNFFTNVAIAAYFQDNSGNGYADRRFSKTAEDVRNYLIYTFNCTHYE